MEELELFSKKDRKQFIWVEKYRPTKMEDYLGNDLAKETFSKYIKEQDFPHIFLYGPPGTGKTTAAKLLVKEINCDHIYINASDESGVETTREKIKTFASSCGFKPLKVIILDEADYITHTAQASLRPMMEAYALTTRFILTGNYHEKLSDAIKSRVQSFKLDPPSKKEVAVYIVNILQKENVKYDSSMIVEIVNTYYPDIRKTIQVCQQFSTDGELRLSKSELISNDFKNKLVEMLKIRANFMEIRKSVIDQGIFRFEDIYEYLYENLDKFAEKHQAPVILALAEGVKSDALVVNKQIVFLACIIEILKVLK